MEIRMRKDACQSVFQDGEGLGMPSLHCVGMIHVSWLAYGVDALTLVLKRR